MKNLFSAALLLLLAVPLITPSFAQKPKSKEESLTEISTLTKTNKPEDMEKAYQLSKEFLTRFGKEKDKDGNIAKVRDFVERYRMSLFFKAADGKKYADTFSLGKEILAEQP
ncbi:MAG: hypothetical protein ABJB40_14460, partial [Acidobacteriota bacterium]